MAVNEKLAPHRLAIDQIDETILNLLNQRAQHARSIGELKGEAAVYRPERESEVLRRLKGLNTGPLSDETVARLFREVMSECLAVERPLTIAYLGPAGTFTQQAAIKHFGHAAHTHECVTIDECFRLVEACQADYVVAPVENSTEGSVGRTLDLLAKSPLKACGEVELRIHHHLLSKKWVELKNINRIYAHSQALAQCNEWINRNIPQAICVAVSSNAEAARLISESEDNASVAIAGKSAADLYHLTKIIENIEDEPNNTTRFLVLGSQETLPSGCDKTSLVVSAPNKPGSVNILLKPFTEQGISMTKFESRPNKSGLWEYLFFIDIEGHYLDENVEIALKQLADYTSFVKVIGGYPQAVL